MSDATAKIREWTAKNKDKLNQEATEFNDGEYGKAISNTSIPSQNNIVQVDDFAEYEASTSDRGKATKTEKKEQTPFYQDAILRQAFKMADKYSGPGFPLENQLEKFASVNFIFSLGVLSTYETNFPDITYKPNGIENGKLILKSGGITDSQGTSRKPKIYAEGLYGIDTAYFIDDVTIDTIIAPTTKVRGSNAVTIEFKINEPYSMGNLLQTMRIASGNAGYENYLHAVYLLMIETIGYDDNGKLIKGETRHIPMQIYNMEFGTSTEGSVYEVQAIPFNETALSDIHQNLQADFTISGRNVEEMLQSGLNSLATNINTNKINNRSTKFNDFGNQADVDEYLILFPLDTTSKTFTNTISKFDNKAIEGDFAYKEFSLTEAFGKDKLQPFPSTGFKIQGEDFSPKIEDQMYTYIQGQAGWSIKRSNLSEGIKQKYTGVRGEVNSIGKAKISLVDPLSGNEKPPFGVGNFAYDRENGVIKRDQTTINTNEKTIQFTKGTSISKIIEEVVMISAYGDRINDEGVIKNRDGWIDWFRVTTSVYALDGKATEEITGRKARIYVYKVVPYKVHRSVFIMPNDPPVGYDRIREQACKHYNYLYTGKNKDVLDFDLNFKNAFFQAIANDSGNKAGNTSLAEKGNNTTDVEKDTNNGKTVPGNSDGARMEKTADAYGNPITAGAITETPSLRVARAFNEALMNSDADLIELNMTIMGDLYFLADSGMGNYVSAGTKALNLKADGTMDVESGQVDVLINFRTPLDISTRGPMFDGKSIGVKDFSGLYSLYKVENMFSSNEFRQVLHGVRRKNQGKPIQVADLLYIDKEARKKRIADAKANGDEFDVALAEADLNGDNRLTPLEISKAQSMGVDIKNAKLIAEGKHEKIRTKRIEKKKQLEKDKANPNLGLPMRGYM
tara:strand:+ start:3509 stop:6226 length:2718 start_codon:yes stop_codon:yes gene_type:complete